MLPITLLRFESRQIVRAPVEKVWEFLVCPMNLLRVMPSWLGLELVPPVPERLEAGVIFSSRIRPFAGLPIKMVSEITHFAPPRFFVDEQRFGPYRFFHHRHILHELPEGTLVIDDVHYAPPLPLLEKVADRLFLREQMEQIFIHRRRKFAEIFGSPE